MGHKVHPKSFRLGTTATWPSRWFASGKNYRDNIESDLRIREFFKGKLRESGLSSVNIERIRGTLTVTLMVAKPGVVIGHQGAGIEELKKKFLNEFFRGKKVQFQLNVSEVPKASLDANVVCEQVILDLERRMPFRRVLKQSIERVKKAGGQGVKIAVSGRLNGAEIARREWLGWGKVPLANLRADIDYAQDFAKTAMGTIGVKVWIYRGDVFNKDRQVQYQPSTPRTPGAGRSGNRGRERES